MISVKAWLLFLSAITVLGGMKCQSSNIVAMFTAIMGLERESMQEPCDYKGDQKKFDFIVVGAGTAGSVLANRLTEVEDWMVLILEAGEEETTYMDIPQSGGMFEKTSAAWQYKTVPSKKGFKSFVNRSVDNVGGKVVGGSSVLNYMLSTRGNRHDYDNWEKMGNTGWKYDDILPYFKKIEKMEIPDLKDDDKYHSTQGNIKISYTPYKSNLISTFLAAGKEMGYPEVDYNGEKQTGFSRCQNTIGNGSRWSASKGYLHPIRGRQNLYLKKRALVTKILIDKDTKTAYGVRFTEGGNNYTVYAKKEVILSAGAIKSAQLLILSGIGPQEHLQKLGIEVIKDSKVGYNVMDHVGMMGLLFTLNQSVSSSRIEFLSNPQNYYDYFVSKKGPLTNNVGVDAISFMELENTSFYSPDWPAIESLYYSAPLLGDSVTASLFGIKDEVIKEYFLPIQSLPSYQISVFPLRIKSRGRISLKDDNIETPPLIDPNYFGNEDDVEVTVAGIRKMIEFSKTQVLEKLGSKLYDKPLPACKELKFGSDDYWRCAVLHLSIPFNHICGTCKMGPSTDETAVVDPALKVHGIKRLRVIDASIIPQIPSGHLQMPIYMIAEKGADLIKEEHLLSTLYTKD